MAKKILIVDDDLYIRDLYEEILKDEGYEVTSAADGKEGLDKLETGGYDLVLLDVMMPKIDGISVLSKLQIIEPKTKNGPIILLTNLSQGPVIEDGMKKGAKSYLIKADLTPDQLVKKVKEFLNG